LIYSRFSPLCPDSYLFDWNAAFIFGPNVPIHYDDEPTFLMPPEAQHNKTAVHATVSAFDVYSTGLLLREILCGKKSCNMPNRTENEQVWLAHDLAALMLTRDPYDRPDTGWLLRHPFLRKI
jgi:hypothetical protein